MPEADTLTCQLPFYLWDTTASVDTQPSHEVNVGIPLDSIFPTIEPVEPQPRQSLFTHHGLVVQHEHLTPRNDSTAPTWIFVLLMVLTLLTFLYNNIHKIKVGELLKTTIDNRAMERLVRENNLSRAAALMPIGLLLCATLGVVIYSAAMNHTGLTGYLLASAALAIGYLLRNAVLRLLGNVFFHKEAISEYITSNYLYHLVLTMALVPVLFLLVYLPWGHTVVLSIAIGMVALTFLMRFIRGAKLFLTISKSFSIYLFYYLCTVEFVPILLLLGWFIE